MPSIEDNLKHINTLINKHRVILELLNLTSKNETMLVGGCVRDFLIHGTISTDTDISTTLSPQEVKNALFLLKKTKDFKSITVLDRDEKYGTIVAICDKYRYEITTTRADINCFGRQAEVKLCKSFEVDSNRRDFTINALYLNINGEIFDYHNGIDDLKNKRIVFIGNPKDRIIEDYLRIIRFVRFSTKFNNFNIDKSIIKIIKENSTHLIKISRERIKSEIWKMLQYNNWFYGLIFCYNINIIKNIFLLDEKGFLINKNSDNYHQQIELNDNNLINYNISKLFYFFNYNKEILKSFYQNLKFTNQEKKIADFLIDIWQKTNNGNNFNIDSKMKLYYSDNYLIQSCISLFQNEIRKDIIYFINNKKTLIIDTDKLIKEGYTGKNLGEKIKELERNFVINNFQKNY